MCEDLYIFLYLTFHEELLITKLIKIDLYCSLYAISVQYMLFQSGVLIPQETKFEGGM